MERERGNSWAGSACFSNRAEVAGAIVSQSEEWRALLNDIYSIMKEPFMLERSQAVLRSYEFAPYLKAIEEQFSAEKLQPIFRPIIASPAGGAASGPLRDKALTTLDLLLTQVNHFLTIFSQSIAPFPKKYKERHLSHHLAFLLGASAEIIQTVIQIRTAITKSDPPSELEELVSVFVEKVKNFIDLARNGISKYSDAEKLFVSEPSEKNNFFDLAERVRKGALGEPIEIQNLEKTESPRQWHLASETYIQARALKKVLEDARPELIQAVFNMYYNVFRETIESAKLVRPEDKRAIRRPKTALYRYRGQKGLSSTRVNQDHPPECFSCNDKVFVNASIYSTKDIRRHFFFRRRFDSK